MPEVLSQSQIDALLAAARSGEMDLDAEPSKETQEKKYRKYDFYSPRKFTTDLLKMWQTGRQKSPQKLLMKENFRMRC